MDANQSYDQTERGGTQLPPSLRTAFTYNGDPQRSGEPSWTS